MSRDALVVGINQYPFLKKNGKAQNLTTPASDAEAIAYLLEKHGNFKVKRLPETKINGKLEVNQEEKVSVEDLKKAIANLFTPKGKVSNTALLYFAGHGYQDNCGISEGYLMTSNANLNQSIYGVSLHWLRRLLEVSEVSQQVIWLDCCHAGELVNFDEANPGEKGKARDRFFVAASREFEVAYKLLDKRHGALSSVLLRGLEPKQYSAGKWIDNFSLAEFIKQELQTNLDLINLPQSPVFHNSGSGVIEIIKGNKSESLINHFNRHAGLSDKETSSSQTNSSSPQTSPQLFEFLLQLDFKEQFKLVKNVLKQHKTVAFLVHGESNCGQQLLVNRLRRVKPQWHKHSPISINVSSRGIGYKLETMWGEVAKYMGQSLQTESEQVFEAILDRLQTQDVIFIFSSIECMLHTKTLKPWLEQFWLPLVEKTKECIVEEDTHLLMFLVDNCGDVCQSKSLFSEQFNPLDYHPHIPLTLPPACPFSLNMIEDWLDLIIGIEELSILIRRDLTAQYLWENSQNGIPEYVFELICKHCGFRWEGGLARWLI